MKFSFLLLSIIFLFPLQLLIAAEETSLPGQIINFRLTENGETKPITFTLIPGKIRADQPADKFAVVYEEAPQKFTGIEIRDAQYWEFFWSDVEKEIEHSKRYARRLHDLNIEGMASYDLERNDPQKISSPLPLYHWKTTGRKQKIGTYFCEEWLGTNDAGIEMQAWCVDQSSPDFLNNIDRIEKINEPMALVPVRPLLPEVIFPVFDSLLKAGVTPIDLIWDAQTEKKELLLRSLETKKVKAYLYLPPSTYRKVDLIALEGITEDQDKNK